MPEWYALRPRPRYPRWMGQVGQHRTRGRNRTGCAENSPPGAVGVRRPGVELRHAGGAPPRPRPAATRPALVADPRGRRLADLRHEVQEEGEEERRRQRRGLEVPWASVGRLRSGGFRSFVDGSKKATPINQ